MKRSFHWLKLGLLILLGGLGSAVADPGYIQLYEAANPDDPALEVAARAVREHKNVVRRDDLPLMPFHQQQEPLRAGEAFCQTCHSPLPHTQKLRDRTFLNMHSRFIACETCHFRPRSNDPRGSAFHYQWLDYRQWQATSGHPTRFRTNQKLDNAAPLEGTIKIAPFTGTEPAIARRDSAFTATISQIWQGTDTASRIRLKAKLHLPLAKKGPECAACHTENKPLLDLAALGASSEQVAAIQRHIIPQFFSRYRTDEERLKIIDILH